MIEDTNHIIIEAAHFYAGDDISQKELLLELQESIKIAKNSITILEKKGFFIERSLFIDDTEWADIWKGEKRKIHLESKSINGVRQAIVNEGYIPTFDFIESHFEHPAKNLAIDLLHLASKSEQFEIVEEQRILIEKITGKKIKLFGKNDNLDYPSCELLDLCVYQEKLFLSDVTITILPISYKAQQEKVKKLFLFLKKEPPIIVIYFSTDGSIVEINHFSNKTKLFNAILEELHLASDML